MYGNAVASGWQLAVGSEQPASHLMDSDHIQAQIANAQPVPQADADAGALHWLLPMCQQARGAS